MLLLELQTYLRERRTASLVDLEIRFRMSGAALRDALSRLERKGRVRRMGLTGCGSGCGQSCQACPLEIYEWIP